MAALPYKAYIFLRTSQIVAVRERPTSAKQSDTYFSSWNFLRHEFMENLLNVPSLSEESASRKAAGH